MKICAIICEYNPFHNGHLWHIEQARALSRADAVLCVMSGNFVQRGESAVMDKYTRAKHAVLAGADVVIELPTVFATANAELFAKGAVKLLSSIPAVDTLCFGAENADKLSFVSAARYLNDEPKSISDKIKELTATGISYAKARAQAWAGFIPFDILSSPNNILGLEYAKALLALKSGISILPVQRQGAGYSDSLLQENFSSATAIRQAIKNGKRVDGNLPNFVVRYLPEHVESSLEALEKYALLSRTTEEIASVCDCTEGLENALKRVAGTGEPLVEALTSARYTSSRIRRIALQNLLQIDENLIRNSLESPLYLRVLAINKEKSEVLSAISESEYPLLARVHDEKKLSGVSLACYEKDIFAEKIYATLYPATNAKRNIFL